MGDRSILPGSVLTRGRVSLVVLAVAALVAGLVPSAGAQQRGERVDYWLTVLHHNDGESQLLNAGAGLEDYGGVARFATLVKQLRKEATTGRSELKGRRGAVLISSGDNYLAGPEFSVSLRKGPPFYDAITFDLLDYDAITIGNHEFDFGPDVFADFIESFGDPPPFISANLDVSAEPRLAALADKGIIVGATVVRERGEKIGIVGATTPALRSISSPRDVVVDPDVADAIQAQVDALTAQGIDKIIVSSHLQSVEEDIELAGLLDDVDIMIAGGGDELLANPGDLLLPGDEADVYGPYPLLADDVDGDTVPIVTGRGGYTYVGELIVGFDRDGEIVAIADESGPNRVSGVGPDAVAPDRQVQRRVVDPVTEALAGLAENVVATSQVDLDGRRSVVRGTESNEGNLIADSLLWQATQLADEFGVDTPQVALQNGGGIRNDSIIPAGSITELQTFDMVPFPNFVSVVEDVPRDVFLALLENAYSRIEFGDGRFAQIAGFRVVVDPSAPAGDRVVSATLDDGTALVTGGAVVPGDPIDVATIDFLARGGDDYPFGDLPFTTLGVVQQQALLNYLEQGLGGVITAADYPLGGEGRIDLTP